MISGFASVSTLVAVIVVVSVAALTMWSDGCDDYDLLRRQLLESSVVRSSALIGARIAFLLSNLATLTYMVSLDSIVITAHRPDNTTTEIKMIKPLRFCTFTVWSWCLQSLFFALVVSMHLGLIPATPVLVRVAVVLFEVSLAIAMLVTIVVSFVLLPVAIRSNARLDVFFTISALMMHNANLAFMVAELLMNQVTAEFADFPFVLLFGASYVVFSWLIADRTGTIDFRFSLSNCFCLASCLRM